MPFYVHVFHIDSTPISYNFRQSDSFLISRNIVNVCIPFRFHVILLVLPFNFSSNRAPLTRHDWFHEIFLCCNATMMKMADLSFKNLVKHFFTPLLVFWRLFYFHGLNFANLHGTNNTLAITLLFSDFSRHSWVLTVKFLLDFTKNNTIRATESAFTSLVTTWKWAKSVINKHNFATLCFHATYLVI